MKMAIFWICVLLIATGVAIFLRGRHVDEIESSKIVPHTIHIGSLTIPVTVVNTPELRERGLSGLRALPVGTGMLFDMESIGNHGIWMKEMLFSIDILWIDELNRINTIIAHAGPDSYPRIFYPSSPALYVLEVNAGFAEEQKIKIGDRVSFVE